MTQGARLSVVAVLVVLLAPPVLAQSTGSIGGTVRDTTGAVLPGVTIEAASPALIEQFRTAVSDGNGNYLIIDLRPGTYTVTLTLPGFSPFVREGLELNTGVTATVNAEMRVGGVEEAITVTGASPVVDVQNVRQQNVFSREVLDSVPNNKTAQGFASMLVGARMDRMTSHDVGGNQAEAGGSSFGIHGNRGGDLTLNQDGMTFNNFTAQSGTGSGRFLYPNQISTAETVLETGGQSAEATTGGIQLNIVPKEGANEFSFYFAASGSNPDFQNTNLNDELRARGLTTDPAGSIIRDVGFGVGGPIAKDRLWFYTAHRWWGNKVGAAANFGNALTGQYIGGMFDGRPSGVTRYEPDLSYKAFQEKRAKDNNFRLTWQAAERHKINFSHAWQDNCSCYSGTLGNTAPEATTERLFSPATLTQATWSNPLTNRLLFEAGLTVVNNGMAVRYHPVGGGPDDISISDSGFRYGAARVGLGIVSYNTPRDGSHTSDQTNARFAMSYVTGSHNLKTGLQLKVGEQFTLGEMNRNIEYNFVGGVPRSLRLWAGPLATKSQVRPELALYAQDQWVVDRLTLNLGVRVDHLNARVPAVVSPAGPYVGERSFGSRDNVPNWWDISPRLGVAYDLFNDGRTAIKGYFSRYNEAEAIRLANANNPSNLMVTNASRTWTDLNEDFVPDCDLIGDPAGNGECGPLSNTAFGTLRAGTEYDPAILDGFGVRPYNWQTSWSLEHELAPGVGVTIGYFRTWYGNFRATDNVMVGPSDYAPYSVIAPVDSRLGNASGATLGGLYDVNPDVFGLSSLRVTEMANFGKQTEVYNGVDVTMHARLREGWLIQGGFNTGQTVTDNCVVVDSPQAERDGFCKVTLPFEGQTQFKVSGMAPLPWDSQVSWVYQNLAGIPIGATGFFQGTVIAPSLGRAPSAGLLSSFRIPMIEPNTMFEDRLSQLDVRLTKTFRIGRVRVQGQFDVYNLFNANSILAINEFFTASWLVPRAILAGRTFKFGTQIDF